MDESLEKSAMRKIYLRLLPFAVVCYILAYLDRINGSFAALTMQGDLHMSAGDYGFAFGTFYWAYFLFEVPSNVIMEKVGARIWIARIMVTWGIFAAATAFVTGPTSFGVLRFLLGMGEAGFFPGLILYFTYWFPARQHARIVSYFLIGLPVAVAIGAPISGALLSLHGLFGYKGWQIMYFAEGVPTIVLGVLFYFLMTDRPEQASFLTREEKDWLAAKLAGERKAKDAVRTYSLLQSLWNPKVLLLSLNYLGIVTASLGILAFVPQIMKSLTHEKMSNMEAILLTMVPYICGAIALLTWGRSSDRTHERRWHLLMACLISTAGLVLAGLTIGTWWAMIGVCMATIGFYGSKGPFFAMPPMFLSGASLAAGIAWINSIGNLGGFFGPWWIGVMKDLSGSFSGGLYGLALLTAVSSIVCALFLHIPDPSKTAAPVPAPAE
jgi:ACS family tartrate transporter-like MFS transporter